MEHVEEVGEVVLTGTKSHVAGENSMFSGVLALTDAQYCETQPYYHFD